MFLKVNTEILSLFELAVSKAGDRIINFFFIPVAYFTSSAARLYDTEALALKQHASKYGLN